MDSIKNIIPDVIEGIGTKRKSGFLDIQEQWKRIAGTKVTRHASVAELQNGCLVINVDSPAWLFQLKLQKRKMEGDVRREIPSVKKIYFRIGKVL